MGKVNTGAEAHRCRQSGLGRVSSLTAVIASTMTLRPVSASAAWTRPALGSAITRKLPQATAAARNALLRTQDAGCRYGPAGLRGAGPGSVPLTAAVHSASR